MTVNRKNRTIFHTLCKWALLRTLLLGFMLPLPVSAKVVAKPVKTQVKSVTDKDILQNSQVSYLAEGGFTGVHSFSVIISCVNGRISTLKSIHNPKITGTDSPFREKGTLDQATYLQLWKSLNKQNMMELKSAAKPKYDIRDEFTLHFEARVGKQTNEFNVYGISRPEACRYFAIKSTLDRTAHMREFWDSQNRLALR